MVAAPGLSASTLSSLCSTLHKDSATQALLEKDAFQLLYFLCFSPRWYSPAALPEGSPLEQAAPAAAQPFLPPRYLLSPCCVSLLSDGNNNNKTEPEDGNEPKKGRGKGGMET